MIKPLSTVVKGQIILIVSKHSTHITYQLQQGSSLLANGEIGQIPVNQGIKYYIIDNGTNQHDMSLDMSWKGHISCVIFLPKYRRNDWTNLDSVAWTFRKCQFHDRKRTGDYSRAKGSKELCQ